MLSVADLFIVPYKRTESASGTLTFAVNAGTPVLSTPFPYAKEMLGDDIGEFIEYND